MLDIGWSEMALIALVALIVIGPKDLPKVMRTMAHWTRKARAMAREFQSGVDDMIRESELDEARKAVEATRNLNLKKKLEEEVDPTGEVDSEARELERAARTESESDPAEGESEQSDRGKIVRHPAQIAPGHSIKPPKEEAAAKIDEADEAESDRAATEASGTKTSGTAS